MTRAAEDIGAGLIAARVPRRIPVGSRIHVVGVAGAGASAAAILAQAAGAVVSGCDPGGPSPYTPAVEAAAIPIVWAHDPEHVTGDPPPDRLAVTKALTAISPDHPELAAAREAGIPLEPWHQVVADAAVGRRLVAVAGTHGKSTTAGWLVHVLASAGRDPSAFVGALLTAEPAGGMPATARVGAGSDFVVEADEYAGNFEPYQPAVAVVTNVEWDHPDVFADLDAALDLFEGWLRRTAASVDQPTLVINVGDPGAATLRERLRDWPGTIVEVAVAAENAASAPAGAARAIPTATVGPARLTARVVSAGPEGTSVELAGGPLPAPLAVQLATAGRHNVANAVVVAGAALVLGVSPSDVARGLETFQGVGRRLERLGEAKQVVVYDDYGHHPTAIRETLAAIRQREPSRRIWAVYEPLTYHRTAAMLDSFADVLATADAAVIADIWAGRDPDTTVTSARKLASAIRRRRKGMTAEAPGSVEETATWLAGHVQPHDAVLVMGGGRSYQIGRLLLEALGR
jgi:UDP-N-acetylmuramate--alanine ligase